MKELFIKLCCRKGSRKSSNSTSCPEYCVRQLHYREMAPFLNCFSFKKLSPRLSQNSDIWGINFLKSKAFCFLLCCNCFGAAHMMRYLLLNNLIFRGFFKELLSRILNSAYDSIDCIRIKSMDSGLNCYPWVS